MDRRTALILLIKIFPLYFLALIVWQYTGVAVYYHKLLAMILSFLYEEFDPTGPIKGVATKDVNLLIKLLVSGKKSALSITAQDVTSNSAMLLALYFASPIRTHLKRFAGFLLCSLFLLLVIHLITVYSLTKYALMGNAFISSIFPPGRISVKLIPIYISFYTNIGMHLFIIILWLPYIGSLIKKQTAT